MPVYEYRGFNAQGKTVKGLKEADTQRGLRALLRKDGIMITESKEAGGKAIKQKGEGLLSTEVQLGEFFQRISVEDLGMATRQLATLLQAGVSMVDSLSNIVEQMEKGVVKRVYSQVKTDINEGSSLADALEKHKCFTRVYVNMVRAGEASGTLDVVLSRLADFIESQNELKSKVMSAMMYPIIMIFVGVGIMGILFTVVVPRITKIFKHTGADLPFQTKVLIWVSSFMADYWWLLIIMAIAGFFGFKKWAATPKGRAKWDRIKLKVPVFGGVVLNVAVARFTRTLATLLDSGVPLLVSFEIVKNVVNNEALSDALSETKEAIREGADIAPPLKKTGQFPPMVTQMIAIGEKSGRLEEMLGRVANTYETQVANMVSRLTALLEPIMILMMGGTVGFVVFSILKPILQMNTMVR